MFISICFNAEQNLAKNMKYLTLFLAAFVLFACGNRTSDLDRQDPEAAGLEIDAEATNAPLSDLTTDEAGGDMNAPTGYAPGDLAQDFSLKNVDGSMVSLADMEDAKGFIVTFTCNHCPFSVAYEDRLIALDKKYKPLGYPVVAINPNNPATYPTDDYESMKVRAKEKGFTFPYLVENDDRTLYKTYGATKTPHMYVLEKTDEGNVVRYVGAIDDSAMDADNVKKRYIEDAVDALLRGETVAVPTTKAVGCSIKA